MAFFALTFSTFRLQALTQRSHKMHCAFCTLSTFRTDSFTSMSIGQACEQAPHWVQSADFTGVILKIEKR